MGNGEVGNGEMGNDEVGGHGLGIGLELGLERVLSVTAYSAVYTM